MADRSNNYKSPLSHMAKVKIRRADGSEAWLDERTADSPHVKALGITIIRGEVPDYVKRFAEIPPINKVDEVKEEAPEVTEEVTEEKPKRGRPRKQKD